MAETENPVQAYQFHALLRGINPPIWRRLLVRGDSSVADLHHTLQIAVRWSDFHLHRFLIRGKEYGISRADSTSFTTDPKRVDLADFGFRPRERFLYEYDFSDLWQHQVRFEATRPVEAGNIYPVCVGGARAAPPEDCGGPSAYMELLDRHQLNWPHEELFLIAETMSRLLGAKEDENICTRLGVALPFTKIFTPSITKMSDMISLAHLRQQRHNTSTMKNILLSLFAWSVSGASTLCPQAVNPTISDLQAVGVSVASQRAAEKEVAA